MFGWCILALAILNIEQATAHKHQNGKFSNQIYKARLNNIYPRSSIWHQYYSADYCNRRYN